MDNGEIRGRFLWQELMTTDADAACAFYSKITGWASETWEQDSSYRILSTPNNGPVGGVMQLPESEQDAGTYWLPYIGTDDIESTVESAERLGASVVKEVSDVPNVGKYAILTDPQGAKFGLLQPSSPPEGSSAESVSETGKFSWHELGTSDADAAWSFYQELFGWQETGVHDMGEEGLYRMFGTNGTPMGGIYKCKDHSPSWLGYVSVPSAQDVVETVRNENGQVVVGPMEVPSGDVIVQIQDPQGALFAVIEARSATAAKAADKPKRARKPKAASAVEAEPESTPEPVSEAEDEEAEEQKPAAKAAPAAKARKTQPKAQAKRSAKAKASKSKAPAKKAVKKAAKKSKAVAKAPARKSKAAAKKAPAPKKAVKKTAAKAPARKKAKTTKLPAKKAAPRKAAKKKSKGKKR